MPKSEGPQTFNVGRFFVGLDIGKTQRPFIPGTPPSKGAQVFPAGVRMQGEAGVTDGSRPMTPGKVTSKGPQTQKSTRFGDTTNQNQDPSKPYNP